MTKRTYTLHIVDDNRQYVSCRVIIRARLYIFTSPISEEDKEQHIKIINSKISATRKKNTV